MTPRTRGLLLAALHVALVASLGLKLRWDRARCPRAWVRTVPVDPNLPIRGRYVSLRLEVPVAGSGLPAPRPRPSNLDPREVWPRPWDRTSVSVNLVAAPEGLRAEAVPQGAHPAFLPAAGQDPAPGPPSVVLQEPVAFFIPEHVPDPSRREPGEELWVEVTLPHKGPPRPIQLGVKRSGVLTPLPL